MRCCIACLIYALRRKDLHYLKRALAGLLKLPQKDNKENLF